MWLYKCRHYICKDDYECEPDYYNEVYHFSLRWAIHYEMNQSFYTSENFSQAVLMQRRMEQVRFIVEARDGTVDITDYFIDDITMTIPEVFNSMYEAATISDGYIPFRFDFYKKMVYETFSSPDYFKTGLRMLAKYHAKDVVNIPIIIGAKRKRDISVEQVPQLMLSNERKVAKDVYMTKSSINKRIPYEKHLRKFGIAKPTFHNFTNDISGDTEYSKRFATRMAFCFSLPAEQTHKLLSYMGYSLKDSVRPFDKLVLRAISQGQSFDNLSAQIHFHNSIDKRQNEQVATLPQEKLYYQERVNIRPKSKKDIQRVIQENKWSDALGWFPERYAQSHPLLNVFNPDENLAISNEKSRYIEPI